MVNSTHTKIEDFDFDMSRSFSLFHCCLSRSTLWPDHVSQSSAMIKAF